MTLTSFFALRHRPPGGRRESQHIIKQDDIEIDSIFDVPRKPCRVFSSENARDDGLHQPTRVTAAVAAHEAADGVAGGVETWDGLFRLVQCLSAAVDQDSAHGEGDAGHDSQAVKRRTQ